MRNLRWVKGRWETGKYKLQYDDGQKIIPEWKDVPLVEENQSYKWCSHMDQTVLIDEEWKHCPFCGKRKPHG